MNYPSIKSGWGVRGEAPPAPRLRSGAAPQWGSGQSPEVFSAPLSLESSSLEENLLAVLCRLTDSRQTLRVILARIALMEPKARMDTLEKLATLAGLRRLITVVEEEVKEMAITFDVMENEFFRKIFIKGRLEGIQEGIQIGERQTHLKGEAALLLRQLKQRFGSLPGWVPERIDAADATTLETWGDRILTAQSLQEVFGE
ncbi:MAG: DUF4351 domain-containing protein [Magnetococcales bacterium]|nr:DUF4351 domain-containing protein [Magnetococcales bacterium]